MTIGDYVASGLRTVVSYLYGLGITALLAAWQDIPAELADWLGSDMAYGAVAAAAAAGWYMAWRWLEPRLPSWLTRLTLGSARSPGAYTRKDVHLAA